MGNNGVKGIVLIALLVVVSFIIGSQISSDKTVSFGIIGAMVGGFTLLYLGERSWWLLFIVPVFWGYLHISLPNGLSPSTVLALVILLYWVVMRIMGYVRIKWHTLLPMDLIITVLFCYTLYAYYRHPSSVSWLGFEAEYVGGKEYILCLLETFAYVAVSILPITFSQIRKMVKVTFYLGCFMTFVGVFRGGATAADMSDGEGGNLMEEARTTRFTLFVPIGLLAVNYIYASTPIAKLFSDIKKLFAVIIGMFFVLLSGWRSTLIGECLSITAIAFLKRELTLLVLIATACYGGLYYLSSERALDDLPFGVQRTLRAIPGIHVSRKVESDADGSSEWRKVMWRWALDPRTGYIKDYIWGDGFGLSVSWLHRYNTALMRGTLKGGDQSSFAANGTWHSGWITVIHRLGLIGLGLVGVYQIVLIILVVRTAFIFKQLGPKEFGYFCFLYVGLISNQFMFYLTACTAATVYNSFFYAAVMKLFYCAARDEGLVQPLFRRESYVPLTIREIEANNVFHRARPAIEAPQA